jgi:hypothetical protein
MGYCCNAPHPCFLVVCFLSDTELALAVDVFNRFKFVFGGGTQGLLR